MLASMIEDYDILIHRKFQRTHPLFRDEDVRDYPIIAKIFDLSPKFVTNRNYHGLKRVVAVEMSDMEQMCTSGVSYLFAFLR